MMRHDPMIQDEPIAMTNPSTMTPRNAVPMRHWLAVIGSMLGAFMAVLDIQITNASLKDILGTLGATMEEGSWVSTSYLVAEIVVIPLTAWLADVFSVRRYLVATTIGFLVSSVACAWAWDLQSLILFRVVQGFTGGAMIPMALALVLRLLPPDRHALGFALFGMTATLAPAIGPSIGGWLTDNFGWPWIFYLNLIPGAIMIIAITKGLEREPARPALLRDGDWPGILTMAVGLGCLITLLEEGHRHDWMDSVAMRWLAGIAAICLVASVIIEWNGKNPFLDLRLLARKDFAVGCAISVAFGLGMYGVMFALPVYLAQVQGYNAGQIGRTIMWSGIPQLVMMPLAALLTLRVDSRKLVALGLALFAASCFMNGQLTALTAHDQLRASQMLRALGMPLVIVPLTGLATRGLSAARSGSASALFNMLRNLGGSIGIAMVATRVDDRGSWHARQIGESLSAYDATVWNHLRAAATGMGLHGTDPVTAAKQSLALTARMVQQEAAVRAFGDAFTMLGIALVMAIPLVLLLPRQNRDAAGGTNFAGH